MASSGLVGTITQSLDRIRDSLSFGGSSSWVGLNIGTSSIKIVELKKSGKAWKLVHFGVALLPEGAVVDREIVNTPAVIDTLKSLVSQLKLNAKTVCTSVSGNSVIIKRLLLDIPNAKEIQEQVFWEAEQYIPYDPAEVYMDYQVLSRGKDNKTDVILVAVKKQILEGYASSIEACKLKAGIVDVDLFAIQNSFELNGAPPPDDATFLVDVGAGATKMVVLQGGIPVFTKDSALCGNSLTAEIQRHLNLSFADAESLKTGGAGNGVPQEVSELMLVQSENLAAEVKRAIDFYGASSTGAPLSQVVLTGGGALLPQLGEMIAQATGLSVSHLDPFQGIQCDPKVFTQDYLDSVAFLAAVPIGLALRAGAK